MLFVQKTSPSTKPLAQRGFTLIEALVAMLILALALVGMAALQSSTLKYQYGSNQRAALSVLLADFAERVRTNLAAAPAVGDTTSKFLLSNAALGGAIAAPSPDCRTSNCTSVQLAEHDMLLWRAAVREQLPDGAVQVAGDVRSGLRVTFLWRDKEYNSVIDAALKSRTAPLCSKLLSTDTGMARQSCCPDNTAAGVRCANFTVYP